MEEFESKNENKVDTTEQTVESKSYETTSYKVSEPKKKSKGASSSVIISFLSGALGAIIIVAVCFCVPSVNTMLNGLIDTDKPAIEVNSNINTQMIDLTEFSETSVNVAEQILPSIVGITIEYTVNSMFQGTGTSTASGSGIIISEDGYILTNNHIVSVSNSSSSSFYQVSEANKIKITLYNDENEYEAEIIGTDAMTDLAVLKIEKTGLKAAKLGDSEKLRVGEFVMAAGNPLKLNFSVTTGVISALNREISDSETGYTYNVIQTNAAINSGNSGGALVNSKGEVIGINFMKISSSSVEGICFAIPISPSLEIIQQLIENGKILRPYIGIVGVEVTPDIAKRYNLVEGVYVENIDQFSGAKRGGIEIGDVIIEIDGNEVKTMDDINEYKYTKNIGDVIKVKVNRNGEELEFDIELIEEPQN